MDMQALAHSTHAALEAAFGPDTPALLAAIGARVGTGVRYGTVTRQCARKLEAGATTGDVWRYVKAFEARE